MACVSLFLDAAKSKSPTKVEKLEEEEEEEAEQEETPTSESDQPPRGGGGGGGTYACVATLRLGSESVLVSN